MIIKVPFRRYSYSICPISSDLSYETTSIEKLNLQLKSLGYDIEYTDDFPRMYLLPDKKAFLYRDDNFLKYGLSHVIRDVNNLDTYSIDGDIIFIDLSNMTYVYKLVEYTEVVKKYALHQIKVTFEKDRSGRFRLNRKEIFNQYSYKGRYK